MLLPDQPLHVYSPPTQLPAINYLVAWLAYHLFWRKLCFSLTFTANHRSTPRQYSLFNSHSLSSSHASLHSFVLFFIPWLLLRTPISSYILLLNGVLGIFSHDPRLCGEYGLTVSPNEPQKDNGEFYGLQNNRCRWPRHGRRVFVRLLRFVSGKGFSTELGPIVSVAGFSSHRRPYRAK